MSEPTKDASGVPLGEVPETLQRQRERTRQMLEEAQTGGKKATAKRTTRTVPVVSSSAAVPEDAPPAETDAPATPKPVTSTKWQRRPITLEHTLISFDLEILDFSISNRFLTVIFEKAVKMPEPVEPTEFKLHVAGRAYRVEHMGINFEIPTLGLRGVSFLLIEDSK